MLEDSSEVMIGPSRRRNAFRLGIVLLALSALVSVVARAFEPQQPNELMIAASVATGPGLWKLVVGRGTPFPGGTRTRRTLDSRLLNEKLDSGHGARWTGAVRPGMPIRETTNPEPGWVAIVSLASGIGAFATSLPFWLLVQLFVAGGMRGGLLSTFLPSEGVMEFLLSEGVLGFLMWAASILGLSALVFGGVATGTHKRSTSGHRMGRVGMILGGVGAGSTWLILALFMLFMFAEIFGG